MSGERLNELDTYEAEIESLYDRAEDLTERPFWYVSEEGREVIRRNDYLDDEAYQE